MQRVQRESSGSATREINNFKSGTSSSTSSLNRAHPSMFHSSILGGQSSYDDPYLINPPPPAPGMRGAPAPNSSSWDNQYNNGGLEEDDEAEEDEDDSEDGSNSDQEERSTPSIAVGKKRKRAGGAAANGNGNGAAAQSKAKGKGKASNNSKSNNQESDIKKPKPTRGSKACQKCRALKMKCIPNDKADGGSAGAEGGPPCQRCANAGTECIFVESNRGKKGGKSQKTEQMAQSLKQMEATLATLLQAVGDPSARPQQLPSMLDRPPSLDQPMEPGHTFTAEEKEKLKRGWKPSDGITTGRLFPNSSSSSSRNPTSTQPDFSTSGGINMSNIDANFVNPSAFNSHLGSNGHSVNASSSTRSGPTARFSEPMPHYRQAASTSSEHQPRRTRHGSPRLHSLPDNALNPLGLLAEASLHNSNRVRRMARQESSGSLNQKNKDGSTGGSNNGQSPAFASIKTESEAGNDSAEKKSNAAETPGESSEGKAYGDHVFEFSVPDAPSSDQDGKGKEKEKSSPSAKEEKASLGVASDTYFKPGPMTILPLRRIFIERERPPEILTSGIVSSHEVLELFRIFFHHCAQHMLLLDAEWHTPALVFSRSSFLFTCVVTVASKFYTKRPDLHSKCLAIAKKLALDCMGRGYKSVEIVQGFLLLTMWNQPAERWEEDKTWLFSGIAIRMAQDLNLHRKSVASLPGNPNKDDPAVIDREREIINRERTWYLCFCVDRSLSAQMGKPYTIREDWIIRNCKLWSLQRLSKPWDAGISALVDLQKTHSRQLDFLYSSTTSVSGLNTDIDYSSVLRVFNEQLEEWKDLWKARGLFGAANQSFSRRHSLAAGQPVEELDEGPPSEEDFDARTLYFMYKQTPMRFGYVSLILNSFGLQHSLDHPDRAGADRGIYFSRCLQAAKEILWAAANGMRPVLRYSPDTHFVMISYAAVFLLKLTRPIFQAFNDEEEILQLVSDTAELLDDVAVNEQHTPALYASFLRALLQTRRDRSTGANTPYGRSRATSPVEGDGVFPGGSKDTGAGEREGVEGGGSNANEANGQEGDDSLSAATRAAFHSQASGMDNFESGVLNGLDPSMTQDLLNDSFWSQLLPPGFGAPLDQLSSVGMHPIGGFQNGGRATGSTPSQTRPSTPSMLNSFSSNIGFDFNSGSFS